MARYGVSRGTKVEVIYWLISFVFFHVLLFFYLFLMLYCY